MRARQMAPDEDDDVLDAWRSCGHAVRVKTLDVVVDGASENCPFSVPRCCASYANHSRSPNARLELWPVLRPAPCELAPARVVAPDGTRHSESQFYRCEVRQHMVLGRRRLLRRRGLRILRRRPRPVVHD